MYTRQGMIASQLKMAGSGCPKIGHPNPHIIQIPRFSFFSLFVYTNHHYLRRMLERRNLETKGRKGAKEKKARK